MTRRRAATRYLALIRAIDVPGHQSLRVGERSLTGGLDARARNIFIVSRPKKNGFFGLPNNVIEEALGVPATTRNWSAAAKIATFVRSDGESDIIER